MYIIDIPPVAETVIPLTANNWLVIVITMLPYTPDPSFAVALTVTEPLSIAVKRPALLIVARLDPSKIDHVTDLSVALAGRTASLNWSVPLSTDIDVAPTEPVTVIPATGITCLDIV